MEYIVVWAPKRGCDLYAVIEDNRITWTCKIEYATKMSRSKAFRIKDVFTTCFLHVALA